MPRSADDRFFDRIAALEAGRVTEASAAQRAAVGVAGYGLQTQGDTLAFSHGFRPVGRGAGGQDLPDATRNRARADSVVAARANPMGRAIVDTYTAFVVGDSGLTLQCTSDVVRPFVEAFRDDPRNAMVSGAERMFRSWLLPGEMAQEMLVGEISGVVRRKPLDVRRVKDVEFLDGNVLWPERLILGVPGLDDVALDVVQLDDVSGLRAGEVMWWPAFQTFETDTRGVPFLLPILDQLDSYDQVLSNLIDRTALARYFVWDVEIDGDQDDVDAFVEARGNLIAPGSGAIEAHTKAIQWKMQSAQTGSYEDTNTNKSVLTSVAAGAGLSKVWLAEPEDANRATSLTMAEPVRRRIGSVQNDYVANLTEMYRFVVDRAVAAGRVPALVEVDGVMVPAAMTVSVTGPQVAAADAQVTAEVLVRLGGALAGLVSAGLLSVDAARVAAQKGWEDYVGVPFRAELAAEDANPDDVATHVEDTNPVRLVAVGEEQA